MGEIDEGGRIWTTIWPFESGRYWFYGWKYGRVADHLPGLHVVQVKVGSDPTAAPIVRLIDNQFMYRAEKHVGMFSRIAHPDMPSITALESELEIGRKK